MEGLHVVGDLFIKDKCQLCVKLCVALLFMHFFMGFSCVCCMCISIIILYESVYLQSICMF
jgi:hypothetical protein